jgi:lysophospholipase L1-like esterase
MRRAREWLVNLALVGASILVFLAFCEFVVFRFIWPGSDVPANAFVNELVRYEPNQRGVWRIRDEIAAPYAINAQGWNSGVGDYVRARRPGMERIAVVGDSFVEGLQVPHDRSFGDIVAQLRQEQGPAEVYRFAIAGAPMSQYLHMIEREVVRHRPDWIVVLLIHNDFDESFRFLPGRYTSSFRKLRVEGDRVVGEIAPEPWRPGLAEWLRRSATARFFLYRWKVRPQAIIDALLPAARAEGGFAANVEIGAVLAQERPIRAAADYLIERMGARAREIGAKLVIAMDGDRQAIYAGQPSQALVLNRIAAEAAARHGIPFVDLHPAFAAEWQAKRRRFEFASDGHWNEYGHAVAAQAIAAAMDAAP